MKAEIARHAYLKHQHADISAVSSYEGFGEAILAASKLPDWNLRMTILKTNIHFYITSDWEYTYWKYYQICIKSAPSW